MGRRSSIDSLPKEVRRWLERALTENNFTGYAELESLLKERVQHHPLFPAAVWLQNGATTGPGAGGNRGSASACPGGRRRS